MNFVINRTPNSGSLARPVHQQPSAISLYHGCPRFFYLFPSLSHIHRPHPFTAPIRIMSLLCKGLYLLYTTFLICMLNRRGYPGQFAIHGATIERSDPIILMLLDYLVTVLSNITIWLACVNTGKFLFSRYIICK